MNRSRPDQVVEKICADVASRGLAAVLDYTRRLDGVSLELSQCESRNVSSRSAHGKADPAYLKTLANVRENILTYQRAILNRDVRVSGGPGIELGLRYTPLRRVGVCVPGGTAAYPSTLLMTVVPAQAAGVAEIAVVVPPTRYRRLQRRPAGRLPCPGRDRGPPDRRRQAVAALAYGVEGIAPVDKIVGPGNLFVALAKKHVYGEVDIDSIAGPSEVVLIADETADARYVAGRPDQPGRALSGREHPLDLACAAR